MDDLIIDTSPEIGQPIVVIAHSETKEYPKFQNLLNFPEGDSTFYDLSEAEVAGSRPPNPPNTNPPCTNPPYPRPNFKFLANMEDNRPSLATDTIVVLGTQHPLPKHPKNILPKFD
jgi:hypothetical protein